MRLYGNTSARSLSNFSFILLAAGCSISQLYAAPPSITSIFNAASFDARLTPGEPAAVFGANLGPGSTVSVGGQPAIVIFSSSTQVNFQMPTASPLGATPVTVTVAGSGTSAPFSINLTAYAPAFFHVNSSTTGPLALATHANGLFVNAKAPALPSENIFILVQGLGPTSPAQPDGTVPDAPFYFTTTQPVVLVNGIAATVLNSGLVQRTYGSYRLRIQVPPNSPSGALSITMNIGGATSEVGTLFVNVPFSVGYFQPSGPTWALDSNGSGAYETSDRVFAFAGQPGAIAVTGDWNGDGHTKVGYYLNGFWVLDYNGNGIYDGTGPGGDKFYAFGGASASYVPVVGDWNGDGRTKIGFYNNGSWALDTNGNGTFDGVGVGQDSFYGFGGNGAGEIPEVGDWNGDGRSKVGYFFNGSWVLDFDGDGSFTAADKNYTAFPYSNGDKPVVGDWTGDGTTKIGIFRAGFWILDNNGNGTYDGVGAGQDRFYGFGGTAGEVPMVADWNGSGFTKIGVYVNGFWVIDYNGNGTYDGTGPGTDRFIAFGGASGYQPIIGRW